METTDKELKNQENYQQNETINREIIKRNHIEILELEKHNNMKKYIKGVQHI